MPFQVVHAHMLRHGCGYALANSGHDTRAIQEQSKTGLVIGQFSTRSGTPDSRRRVSRISGGRRRQGCRTSGRAPPRDRLVTMRPIACPVFGR